MAGTDVSIPNCAKQCGFSYAEVLLSVLLLTVLLTPALQALSSGISGNAAALTARQINLRNKMEGVLSTPFAKLYAETYLPGGNTTASVSTSLSDAAGSTDRRVVVLYRYDAASNSLSADDTGLLFISVYYEAAGSATSLGTLAGRWW